MPTSVEDLFSPRSYEASVVLHTASMTGVDRKRMLMHSISDVTQKILQLPNANPVGLAITVTDLPSQPDMHPDLLILATCPQFAVVESIS